MDEQILANSRVYAMNGNISGLKEIYSTLPSYICREYLFKQVFLSACIHSQKEITQWLLELYGEMDPVSKIGLKHVFTFAKYIIKNREFKSWYITKTQ